ncbi:MAG: hypothetical protein HC827_14650 [Cyanobacteria bacterium RM1_2_2]|nr:hypothetical protein [Cyanobacteria bacterium RM1_2_2]
MNLLDLVQELHQIAPTVESLTASLGQVSKALSKPKEYTQIATIISNAFQSCYESKAELSNITEWLTEPIHSDATFASDVLPPRPSCAWNCLSQNNDPLPQQTSKAAPQKVLVLAQLQKMWSCLTCV